MTSQEKALKELIEINFVKMMDGVPVRSSIGMVEKDFQKFLIELVSNRENNVKVQFALSGYVKLNYF